MQHLSEVYADQIVERPRTFMAMGLLIPVALSIGLCHLKISLHRTHLASIAAHRPLASLAPALPRLSPMYNRAPALSLFTHTCLHQRPPVQSVV